jgi:hypothetical protein
MSELKYFGDDTTRGYVSTSDAARLASCTQTHIGRICRNGEVQCLRVGREWYIAKESLDAYLSSLAQRKEARADELRRERQQEYQQALAKKTPVEEPVVNTPPPTPTAVQVRKNILPTLSRNAIAVALLFLTLAASVIGVGTGAVPLFSSDPHAQSLAAVSTSETGNGITSALNRVGDFLAQSLFKLFGFKADEPAPQLPQETSTPVATIPSLTSTTSTPTRTVVVQQTVAPRQVTEQITQYVTVSGISETLLAERLNQLENKLKSAFYQTVGSPTPYATPPSSGGYANNIALLNIIDHLDNVVLNNPTIIGGSISGTSGIGSVSSGGLTASSTVADFFDYIAVGRTATTTIRGEANATSTFAGGVSVASLAIANLSGCDTIDTDVNGQLTCGTDQTGSGAGTPGGANNQVQFNNNGDFGGDAGFTYSSSTDLVTVTNASTTKLSASYASSTQGFFGSLNVGSLTGLLRATAGVVATATIDLVNDVGASILTVVNGGTGWANLQANAILLGNGTGRVATTSAGTNGQVLALVGGVPTWTATSTLATITGTLGVAQGGTGLTSTPAFGELLVGNGTGYTLAATSTLAIALSDTTGTLPTTRGGTNITSYTTGDTLYASATNVLSKLAIGTGGQVLAVVSGIPQWVATTTLSTISGALNLATQVTGDLPFANLTQIAGNSILGNISGATGDVGAIATTSLYTGTNGQVLARVNGTWVGVATTTAGTGLTYDGTSFNANCVAITGSADLCDGNDASGGGGSSIGESFALVNGALAPTTTVGIIVSASSTFAGNVTITGNSTTTNATTTNLKVSNEFTLGTLTGFLKATAGKIATATIDLVNDVGSSILAVANGGTGWANLQANTLLLGNGTGRVSTTTAGTNGQVLALVGGVPTWTATSTLATISGTLAIANGGTNATSQTTNGVNYFNGTSITSGTGLTFTGTNFGIGTTTPQWLLNPTSATASQLALSAGAGLAQWAFRNAGGNLYLATTTVAGTATSSIAALTILGSSGNVGIGTTSPTGLFSIEKTITGTATLGQPTSGYLYTESAYPVIGRLANFSGWNDATAGNTGRTSAAFSRVHIENYGQGDAVAYNASGYVSSNRVGATSFLAEPAVSLFNGDASAGADSVYLNPYETILHDNGFGIAAVGNVNNLDRTNATRPHGDEFWAGYRLQSIGSAPVDVMYSGVGKARFGLDLSFADFSSNDNAAISLAGNQRFYFNNTATDASGLSRFPLTAGYYFAYSTTRNAFEVTVASTTNLSVTSTAVGVGTTSPYAKLSVHANNGETNATLFDVSSSTASATTSLFAIKNTGRVGIGTASPVGLFQLHGGSGNSQAVFTNNTTGTGSGAYVGQLGGNDFFVVNQTSVGHLYLATDSTTRLTITNTGNVGIGTTTPQWLLNPASATAPQLALSAGAGLAQWAFRNAGGNLYLATTTVAGTATTSISAFEISGSGFGTTTVRGLTISGQATSTSNVGFSITSGCYAIGTTCVGGGSFSNTIANGGTATTTFYNGGLVFYNSTLGTLSQASAQSGLFYDNTNSRLGIGTTTPDVALQVSNSSGAYQLKLDGAGLSNGAGLMLKNGAVGGAVYNWYVGANNNVTSALEFTPSTAAGGSTFSSPALAILRTGNVGIGTTTPQTNLAIGGGGQYGLQLAAGASGIYVNPNDTFAEITGETSSGEEFGMMATGGVGYMGTWSAHPLRLRTSNTDRLTIDTSGNVGIGTSTPLSALDVYTATGLTTASGKGVTAYYVTSRYPTLGFNTYNSSYHAGETGYGGVWQYDNQAGDLIYYSGSSASAGAAHTFTTPFTIKQAGNVGIGTTSPMSTLTVANGESTISTDSSETSLTRFIVDADGGTRAWGLIGLKYNSGNSYLFLNASNSSSDSHLVIAETTGNVGIGTSTPQAKFVVNVTTDQNLEVLTNLNLADGFRLQSHDNNRTALKGFEVRGSAVRLTDSTGFLQLTGGNVGIGTTTPDAKLVVWSGNTNQAATFSHTGSAAAGGIRIGDPNTISNNTGIYLRTSGVATIGAAGGDIVFDTNYGSAERMRILNSNGNVGIGTTSPGFLLSLSGGKVAFKSTASTTAAFAVENNYGRNVFQVDTFDNAASIFSVSTSTGATYFTVAAAGNIGVGSTTPWKTFSVAGSGAWSGLNAAASGNVVLCINASTKLIYEGSSATTCTPSSAQFKNTIEDTNAGLDTLSKLRPVTFFFNDLGDPTQQLGFIAEEVFAVDPRLVNLDPAGNPYSLKLDNFIALSVSSIQELNLNINAIASTSATTTPASLAFAASFFNNLYQKLIARLGDTTNGIGKLFAEEVHVKQICVAKSDGTEFCADGDQLAALAASGPGAGNSGGGGGGAPDTEPPVITILGNNPANVTVGDTYADLGATVTDNVDQNLGIHIYMNGEEVQTVVIDTSAPGTFEITYQTTDTAGNVGGAMRTIIVSDSNEPAP